MRENGLSIRAIASATQTSVNTVQSDLQVSQIDTPAVVSGADGKTYQPTRSSLSKPRTDIPRTVNSALIQITIRCTTHESPCHRVAWRPIS